MFRGPSAQRHLDRRSFLGTASAAAAVAAAHPSPAIGSIQNGPRVRRAPAEFEPQEYIWLTWMETGSLGGAPFSTVIQQIIRYVTPHAKVRLLYSHRLPPYGRESKRLPDGEARARIARLLRKAGIDLSRVEMVPTDALFGAIQDPGPFFLETTSGGFAVADYRFSHPDPKFGEIDRNIAARLGLPTVATALVSEGGNRQVNGRGVAMLVKAVETDRNPNLTLDQIEREHRRVLAADKVIWLEQGLAEEGAGRLSDGRWGIGTGGHVDMVARFADASTIVLAEVSERQRRTFPILAQSYDRMEANLAILRASSDRDGRPFKIIRVPVPDPMVATIRYEKSGGQNSWFPGAADGERLEYYLPGGYQNFIIANGVVVTAKLAREGRPASLVGTDDRARAALQRAFPGRHIVQIDITALLHDGAGPHCHSRSQPFIRSRAKLGAHSA